jgi:integrase
MILLPDLAQPPRKIWEQARTYAADKPPVKARLRTSKSGHPRVLPLEGELWEVIERRWSAREVETAFGPYLADLVFHRNGLPLAWSNDCEAAGVKGRLFHDLRRTAVRNMIRADVSQAVAMRSGHRTISLFNR